VRLGQMAGRLPWVATPAATGNPRPEARRHADWTSCVLAAIFAGDHWSPWSRSSWLGVSPPAAGLSETSSGSSRSPTPSVSGSTRTKT
jgi:hypothetical protein